MHDRKLCFLHRQWEKEKIPKTDRFRLMMCDVSSQHINHSLHRANTDKHVHLLLLHFVFTLLQYSLILITSCLINQWSLCCVLSNNQIKPHPHSGTVQNEKQHQFYENHFLAFGWVTFPYFYIAVHVADFFHYRPALLYMLQCFLLALRKKLRHSRSCNKFSSISYTISLHMHACIYAYSCMDAWFLSSLVELFRKQPR